MYLRRASGAGLPGGADGQHACQGGFCLRRPFFYPLHNANHSASSPAALEYASLLSGNPKYRKRARECYGQVMRMYRGEDDVIFGESKPFLLRTTRGCSAVDLGYNLEETYPNLTLYA